MTQIKVENGRKEEFRNICRIHIMCPNLWWAMHMMKDIAFRD
jgi:hypothetical protein